MSDYPEGGGLGTERIREVIRLGKPSFPGRGPRHQASDVDKGRKRREQKEKNHKKNKKNKKKARLGLSCDEPLASKSESSLTPKNGERTT